MDHQLEVALTIDASYGIPQPIDDQVVRSFPVTAPYQGNANFRLLFAMDSHKDTDPVVVSWTTTGPNQVFKQARYYDARCVFLQKLREGGDSTNPMDWQIIMCIDCLYFISKQFGNVPIL